MTAPNQPARSTSLKVALATGVAFLLLCCGGITAIKAFTGGGNPSSTPQFIAPSLASPPPMESTSSPSPSRSRPSSPSPSSSSSRTKIPPIKKPVPARTAPAPSPSKTTKKPSPKPTTTAPPPAPAVVRPGAFCSPEGATGITRKGTPMICTRKPGEERARWRKA
ncbi:hypothetical protein [Winogradskya humida]|uniref:Uncharacterized protein n=1 Tax=Winogradskya humida TaxID=113566 RepID=A0ABQ3ZJC6_9ACTN|nr:hypothetical protein [Actinoplanes humidus]GIE18696.1 hypothetical protein Ahu01nite_017980 [Actinoplanes humidus]